MAGKQSTANRIFALLKALPVKQQDRFIELLAKDPELEAKFVAKSQHVQRYKQYAQHKGDEAEWFAEDSRRQAKEFADKKARGRRSLKIIRRNLEILDLRKKDPKRWSHTLLGDKFGLKRQTIHVILKEAKMWRSLAAALPALENEAVNQIKTEGDKIRQQLEQVSAQLALLRDRLSDPKKQYKINTLREVIDQAEGYLKCCDIGPSSSAFDTVSRGIAKWKSKIKEFFTTDMTSFLQAYSDRSGELTFKSPKETADYLQATIGVLKEALASLET